MADDDTEGDVLAGSSPRATRGGQALRASEKLARITADIPEEDVERLQELAEAIRSNRTTALVRALRTSKLLHDEVVRGGKIFIEADDGSRKEIVIL